MDFWELRCFVGSFFMGSDGIRVSDLRNWGIRVLELGSVC